MPTLKLHFPVWVRHRQDGYQVMPLLFSGEPVTHPRLEKALRLLRAQVAKGFREKQSFDRSDLPELLWYRYLPALDFALLSLDMVMGGKTFRGRVAATWFPAMGGTVVMIPALHRHYFLWPGTAPSQTDLTEAVSREIQAAARLQRAAGEDFHTDNLLATKGERMTTVEQHVYVKWGDALLGEEHSFDWAALFEGGGSMDGGWELARTGVCLNDAFPDALQRAYAREPLAAALRQRLFAPERPPLVLIGPRQGGKTCLLHEVLYQELDAHPLDQHHHLPHLWQLDPNRLIAGMSIVGAWQRRLEAIIQFVRQPTESTLPALPPRRDILFFDNVIALFRVGKSAQNNLTLSDVLKPYLQRGQLQVILEATPEAWDMASEIDRGFTDLFQVVRVPEPSAPDQWQIIGQLRSQMEQQYEVAVENAALLRLIALQRQFFGPQGLTGRMAASLAQLGAKYRGQAVDLPLMLAEFSLRTHLHSHLADPDQVIPAEDFRAHLQRQLIGQPAAIEALASQLHLIKARLTDPERPLGAFLFTGPTGVGKTQAVKVLAEYLFTHEDRLLRFDMNEYIDGGAVARLVGDAYQPEGQLTMQVQHNPFCVLLFDEIEKAHPDVHNLLLQVLGEGRLTDALGQVVSFRNTVIIMTSNLGADRVGRAIRFQERPDEAVQTYEQAIRQFFRPEFINRIDETIVFVPLTREDIVQIARLILAGLLQRPGFRRRQIALIVAPAALHALADRGFDPQMGGRALKRQIERDLTFVLAEKLAAIPAGTPLIIHLGWGESRLQPRITQLIPAAPAPLPWRPTLEGRPDAAAYEGLLEAATSLLDQLDDDIDALQEDYTDLVAALQANPVLLALFNLKDEVRELETELIDLIRQLEIRPHLVRVHPPFQVRVRAYPGPDGGVPPGGDYLVPEEAAHFFAYQQKLAWAHFLHQAPTAPSSAGLGLRLTLHKDGTPPAILDWLVRWYTSLGLTEAWAPSHDERLLLAGGQAALFPLLAPEAGFHLCWWGGEVFPVEVEVLALDTEAWAQVTQAGPARTAWHRQAFGTLPPDREGLIIRYYELPDSATASGQALWRQPGQAWDLRTGLHLSTPADTADLRLLLWAQHQSPLPDA